MRLWIRARIGVAAVVFTTVGTLLVLFAGRRPTPLPQLANRAPIPIALLAPALVAAGILIASRPRLVTAEALRVRRVGLLDGLTVMLPAALIATIWVLGWMIGGQTLLFLAARNLFVYVAVGLLVRALIVDAASAAPIAYAIVCGLLGSAQSLWSIPLAPPSSCRWPG